MISSRSLSTAHSAPRAPRARPVATNPLHRLPPFAIVAAALAIAPGAAAAQRHARDAGSATASRAVAGARGPALIPEPRELSVRGSVALRSGIAVVLPREPEDGAAARDLAATLRERGIRASLGDGTAGTVRVHLLRAGSTAGEAVLHRVGARIDAAMRAEGYVLVAGADRVDIVAASAAGVFYGTRTLLQLIDGHGPRARLWRVVIRDWPAMRWRGVHDDLSRGPVPTLEFQKKQIRTFAAYKLNVYSPYFEHTLEYESNPLPAPPGGAMTRAQVRELVAYARRYHVVVVPEQEAFGHLHHVLSWEQYAPLGETPHGHVLAPGEPGSLPLIAQWFGEIDSLFPGPFVHLGADETFELGRGQTADRVHSEGLGAVYIDFLRRIESMLRPSGKTFLFWGDVAMNEPALVKQLPKDMVAVAWEYSPQSRGFARFLRPFTDAGMQTWVAPGMNNWSRVYPDFAMALPNIQGFVRDGQRLGATGMLNTTWDDDGEALFNQTWYGVLFGAAAAWQSGESSIERFQDSYGRAFQGDTTGDVNEAQRELMAAHALLAHAGLGDGSDSQFWLDPWSTDGQRADSLIRPVARELRLHAERAIVLIDSARMAAAASGRTVREPDALAAVELGARRLDIIGLKYQFADDVQRLYDSAYAAQGDSTRRSDVSHALSEISGINGRLQDLRDAYALTRTLYDTAWRAESRPYWLPNVLARYDLATQLWIERADRFAQARSQWWRTRTLPAPETIGLPPLPAARPPVASAPVRR